MITQSPESTCSTCLFTLRTFPQSKCTLCLTIPSLPSLALKVFLWASDLPVYSLGYSRSIRSGIKSNIVFILPANKSGVITNTTNVKMIFITRSTMRIPHTLPDVVPNFYVGPSLYGPDLLEPRNHDENINVKTARPV
jgi:hypothetical protein